MYEGLQVKVILQSETVSESLVWAFASVVQEFGLCRTQIDHFVFWRIQDGKRILQVVYVDIREDATKEIDSLKKYL